MIHSTVIGRLWGEPEDRVTTTGKSLIVLTLSYQEKGTGKYQYIRLCLWGDKFNKVVPFLKHGTTVFAQGVLLIDTYFSKSKGELVVSLSMNVDALQIIFNPFHKINKEEKTDDKPIIDTEETPFEKPEICSKEHQEVKEEDKKEQEDEDLDWGGAIFSN